ncbi:MAG: hypothetical protein NT031_05910 [Planctomycetota bacterium]|nr:hypothetical protein [Planctomycetota bacterium]
MRIDVSARRGWLVAMMTAAMIPTALRAADPIIDISAERLTGSLSPEDKAQIKAYAAFWAGGIVDAKTPKAAADARRKLVEGYVRFASGDYRYEYADAMSAEVLKALPLLAKQPVGPLRTCKEMYLSQAMADMPQAKSLPALLAMAVHPNAGVRFVGFAGLGKADLEFNVLRLGPEASAPMYAVMANAVANEKEPRVLQAVLTAANLNAAGQMQGDTRLDLARMKLLDIHAKAFDRLAPMVLDADPDIASALKAAMVSLAGLADDASPKQKAAMIQLALNAAYAAVTALDPDELAAPVVAGTIAMAGAAPPAEGDDAATTKPATTGLALPGSSVVKNLTPGEYTFRVATEDFAAFKAAVEGASGTVTVDKPCLNESTALLKECDKLLVKLTNAPNLVITPRLNQQALKARATAVRHEIEGWAKEMKQQYGLQDPKGLIKRPPAPASPASRPAEVMVELHGAS